MAAVEPAPALPSRAAKLAVPGHEHRTERQHSPREGRSSSQTASEGQGGKPDYQSSPGTRRTAARTVSSPTQRTLQHLRDAGFPLVQVVERWNPHARVRQDLFGIVDVLAVSDTEIVAVQATSGSNVSKRVAKLTESPALPILRKAGIRILVHGWRKLKGRWTLREVDLS